MENLKKLQRKRKITLFRDLLSQQTRIEIYN